MPKKYLFIAVFFTAIFAFSSHQVEAASPRSIPILMYHYIRDYNNSKDQTGINLSVSPANFNAQMDYLGNHGFTPISLDTAHAILTGKSSSPAKPVVLTFDDGYIDFYANAFPILRNHHFSAVSFVITGFVGSPAYLSWNNIQEMQSSGLVTFESHTVDHAYLPLLSYANILNELKNSKEALQSHTGYAVNFIAYPAGGSNGLVQKAAQRAGYVGGLGTWYGFATYPSMNMPRVRVGGGATLATFASRL
ncbi:MAG TPA: polysaccharide deacetylase family protein [Patescibacteria group bacterium]